MKRNNSCKGLALRSLALCALASVALGAARAQTIVPRLDDPGPKGDIARKMKEKSAAQFDQADADKDGKLTREEVATVSKYMADNFEKHDRNKDGFLSWEEFVGHNRWPK